VIIPSVTLFIAICIIAAVTFLTPNETDDLLPPSDHGINTPIVTNAVAVTENPPEASVEILDKDYSDSVTKRTFSANNHGIAAIKVDGTVITHDMKDDLSGWSDIVSVSVGGSHVLGLKSDGTVVAMGSNDDGQCDVSTWKDIIFIEAGHYYSIGIKRNGTLVVAGFRFPYIAETLALRDVVMVSSGMHNIAALKADGTVEVIGTDSRGEHLTSGWSDITAIASGDFSTLGLKSDGTVVLAGEHEWENDWEERNGEPPPHWCGDIADWYDITAIAVGRDVIGVKSDGTVIASNGRIMSGISSIADWSDIVDVAFAWNNLIGLKSDGTVVYTTRFVFDDIVELDEWDGIAVAP
jgi:alpha-tubulin suppressor-like RCC1 family protein